MVLVIGETAAQRVNKGIEDELARMVIDLSMKKKASRTFGTTLFALGAEYRLDGAIPTMLPPREKI